MNRTLAALIVGLFAVVAHAQSNPPGVAVPPNTPGVATGKADQAGEARKDRRPQGQVRPAAGGDTTKVPEGGAIGTDKAAVNGEGRAETRDARRPNKRKTMQGGTPK